MIEACLNEERSEVGPLTCAEHGHHLPARTDIVLIADHDVLLCTHFFFSLFPLLCTLRDLSSSTRNLIEAPPAIPRH